VLRENGLPEIATAGQGGRVMLERKRLDDFYRELQTPSRIQANTQILKLKPPADVIRGAA